MTREEMVNAYYTSYDDQNPGYDNKNYEEAQNRIKQAMKSGKKYVYLPGKHSSGEFTWSATDETIARLREDGFDIDKVWNPWKYWSIEWGY